MWRLLILLVLLSLWAGAALAQPMGSAKVRARVTRDGIRASVVLSRPVTRFDFLEASVVREGDFTILTAGLELAGTSVTGDRPFRGFDLLIRPMARERDAKYPAHFRVGDGGILYAPALVGDPAKWRTRLSFKLRRGDVRTPRGEAAEGFVFIGPRRLLSEDRQILVVADPKAPAWLVERSRAALAGAVGTFTEALGAALPRKPLLIVKHEPGERNFNVGDVTPGPVTALRFHGATWEKPDPMAGKQIQAFVLHEAFHFWNGGLASPAPDTPTWLHEGGAEYAALLVGLRVGLLNEEEMALGLGNALNRCRTGLQAAGDKGLGSFRFLPAPLRYPCGMAIQWAADLKVRRASDGRRSVLDVWRETIAAARAREPRHYTLADFYAAAGIASAEVPSPIALLVDRSGADRWNELAAGLVALGADVASVPSPAGRRAALLFHLLKENCRDLAEGTGYGFYIDGRTVKLDAPQGCGGLSGDLVIAAVEGGDPFDMTVETYAAVQRKCAAEATVVFTTKGGRRLDALCKMPLGPPPQDFEVRRWRPAPSR